MEVPSIFLNRILVEAAKKNSSSLHLTVGSSPMMRIDHQLIAIEGEDLVTTELIKKIINFVADEAESAELAREKEIIFVKELAGGFRFRINIFYQKNLPLISFHYIPNTIKTLSDLGVSKVLSDISKAKSGLFIVAGPYGSGKTTTAAAFVEETNKNYKKNIVTIESPIEYSFISKKSLISQRQVGRDVNSTTKAIAHCLEGDADLVYIGEIKDGFESAIPLILELAASNAFVILEINADSSIRVIEKILDAAEKETSTEAARYNLADVLLGVAIHKLVPKLGGGLALANEVMINSSAAKSLIREGKIYQLESIIQTSRREGMISMSKSLDDLVNSGVIKREDINGFKIEV